MVTPEIKQSLAEAVNYVFDNNRKDIIVDAIRHLYFGGFYSNPLEDFSMSEDKTRSVSGATTVDLGSGSGVGRFAGGVMMPTGQIAMIPFNATQIGLLRPESYESTYFGDLQGVGKWMGGAVGNNGKLFAAPFNSNTVLELTVPGNTITTFGNYAGNGKWSGLIPSATNGSLYGIPYNSNSVLRVIPSSRAVSLITIPGVPATEGKWRGGCYVPSLQRIICAPFNHPGALVINPAAGSATIEVAIPNLPAGAFSTCVLWRDDNVYFIPYNADAVYVRNTATGAISKFGKLPLGGQKWMGARVAPNGNIYCIPYNHDSILEIDPVNQELRLIGKFEGDQKWMGGVTTQFGNILAIPHDFEDPVSILGAGVSGPDWWSLSPYSNLF